MVSDYIVKERADIVSAYVAGGFGDGPCSYGSRPYDAHRHQAMNMRGSQSGADSSRVLPVAQVGVGSVALCDLAHVEAHLARDLRIKLSRREDRAHHKRVGQRLRDRNVISITGVCSPG